MSEQNKQSPLSSEKSPNSESSPDLGGNSEDLSSQKNGKTVTFVRNALVEAIDNVEALCMEIAMTCSRPDQMYVSEVLRHLSEAKGWAYNMPMKRNSPIMVPKDHLKPQR